MLCRREHHLAASCKALLDAQDVLVYCNLVTWSFIASDVTLTMVSGVTITQYLA